MWRWSSPIAANFSGGWSAMGVSLSLGSNGGAGRLDRQPAIWAKADGASSSKSTFASLRSAVSKPSVNQS